MNIDGRIGLFQSSLQKNNLFWTTDLKLRRQDVIFKLFRKKIVLKKHLMYCLLRKFGKITKFAMRSIGTTKK